MHFKDYLLRDLVRAYHETRPGKRKTKNEHGFEVYALENIIALRDSILSRSYRPGESTVFGITDPKPREIFAADFFDRVAHRYVYDKVMPWWDRHLSYESFSCRKGKGPLAAQKRLASHILKVTKNYSEPAWLVKVDIKSYFASIDKKLMLDRIFWGLDRQYPNRGEEYQTVKFLWRVIVMDDAVVKMKVRGSLASLKDIPPEKSLRFRPAREGLVIGNLTSQCGSNIFLDQLDRFIRYDLGIKYFVRYVDDAVLVLDNNERERVRELISEIDIFLANNLHLRLHPKKCYVREAHQGIDFLGAVIYPGHIVPGKRAMKRCRADFAEVCQGHKNSDTVVAHEGYLMNWNSKKFLNNLFSDFGWDYTGEWSRRKDYSEPTQLRT